MTGILTLTLDKETYERAGINGKPDGVKGNRGTKPRWSAYFFIFQRTILLNDIVVQVNLRLSSMVHGKRGFDRIVYAFKNILTNPVTWLFTNIQAQGICFL